eukprot:7384459-Pyramimonas_sp.AAC.1
MEGAGAMRGGRGRRVKGRGGKAGGDEDKGGSTEGMGEDRGGRTENNEVVKSSRGKGKRRTGTTAIKKANGIAAA